jgi:hypothetical protein
MSDENFPVELPRDVVSLTATKVRPHRENWILLAARDADCDLIVVDVGRDGNIEIFDRHGSIPYAELWAAIGDIAWPRVSNWTLTFRAGYVLKSAKWIKALESGEIELERQRKLAGKQAGRGSVTLTNEMVDLDLRIGKRKVKILDFGNYGVDASKYVKSLNDLDAEMVVKIFSDWIAMQTKVGLSASRTSAPQIGWAKLRQSIGKSNLFTSLDPKIRALERRCYYGGRCEPFRLGDVDERCYLLDVKACYAHIVNRTSIPYMPLRYMPNGMRVGDVRLDSNIEYAADCVVNVNEAYLPVRHHGKVIYPTGRFFTSLCGLEFTGAMNAGFIERITSAAMYASQPCLSNYAQWYQESRDKIGKLGFSDVAGSLKATFNSSLGFLARQGREWREWSPAGVQPWWFGKTTDPDNAGKVVGAHVLDKEPEFLRIGIEPRNCAPVIHASICATARVVLCELFAIAGDGNVIYCDTDGLIVTQDGYDNLLAAQGMCGPGYGQLSVRAQSSSCTINGQKNYKIGDKVVCAGLPSSKHNEWKKRDAMETTTGIVNHDGTVSPYIMECEDNGDETARWQNVLR